MATFRLAFGHMRAGAVDFLLKPVSKTNLRRLSPEPPNRMKYFVVS